MAKETYFLGMKMQIYKIQSILFNSIDLFLAVQLRNLDCLYIGFESNRIGYQL